VISAARAFALGGLLALLGACSGSGGNGASGSSASGTTGTGTSASGQTVGTPAALLVAVDNGSAVGGQPLGLIVTAQDAAGNAVTSFSGTLEFSSTDPHAVLPAATVVVTASSGFVVAFSSPGMQTISVSASPGTLRGTSAAISVSPRPSLAITTATLVEGTVGDQYGSTLTVYESCVWSPVYGWHYSCVQIPNCGTKPACGSRESGQLKPCCRSDFDYVGQPLAVSGAVNGVTWSWVGAANYSVPAGLTIDGRNIVGTPAAGSVGNYLVEITATDGGLPPASTVVTLPLTILQ
jgi:hypothetical protein